MQLRYLVLAGALIGWTSIAFASIAFAQDSVPERRVKGQAGRDIRIAVFANIRPDCTAGPLPTVRLKQPPSNGSVTVKQARMRTTNVRQCLAVEVPVFVAFYRSSPGFSGEDSALIEVVSPAGKTQLHRIIVTVEKRPAGQDI